MYAHTYICLSLAMSVCLPIFISLAFFIYWYFPHNIKVKNFSTSSKMSPIICCNILLQQNYLHNISLWFSAINTYLFVSSRHSSKLFLKKKNLLKLTSLENFLFYFLSVLGYPLYTYIPPYVLGFKAVLFIFCLSKEAEWMNIEWIFLGSSFAWCFYLLQY